MIDTTKIDFANIVYEKDPLTNTESVSFEDGEINVEKRQFSKETSDFFGLVYHVPQFGSTGKLAEVFGEDVVVDLANDSIAARVRARVTNKINSQKKADPATYPAWLASLKEQGIIFSVKDALEFRPGERELSISGLTRRINKLISEQAKALQSKNFKLANELGAQVSGTMQKLAESIAENSRIAELAAAAGTDA